MTLDGGGSLGSGALGEVKKATLNVAAKRLFFMDPAALRIMGVDLSNEDRQAVLLNFIKECSINSLLRHPNIVMFHGVAVDPNNEPRFLMMELMERSLHDEIYPGGVVPRQGEPLSLARVASILLDVSRALEYLHSRRPPVLHLDLKPKNVLIDRSGTAKVGDLGEAHVIRSTRAETRGVFGIGTPVYMAPEMADPGLAKGPAADMFSLGVMACEMSSSRPPNPGAQIVARRVIPERERRASDLAAIRHEELRELVDHLVVDEADQRWKATDVRSFLEQILAALPA